ncbi:MAG: glycoside hydrolase family 99-like domain-containing protein [Lachnospiraceae bacterium]|nr:glycoside hydrolase family 99-like domain-containing protein [Lachnospiraceae bacterium]
MKIIAFYLPQFHTFPENDEWWGKGFTEWTNVKTAVPIFEGHEQPRIPLNRNYYNLLDIETLRWQSRLAKEYGIYGFCFYHYWFDGKMLMHQPMEMLLKNKDIKQKFCICWANEDWTRAWAKKERTVLIGQTYGEESDWRIHFEYLLPFFQDERYIKIENKPLFIIYRPELIKPLREMLEVWEGLARQYGFEGIALAYQQAPYNHMKEETGDLFDYGIEYQPGFVRFQQQKTFSVIRRKILHEIVSKLKLPQKKWSTIYYDYDDTWKRILNIKPRDNKMIPGAFVDWDNTPRYNQHASVVVGYSKEKFQKYLSEQIKRAKEVYHKDMLFLFAWNEWGEGGYLEPDEEEEYGRLSAVRESLKSCNEWEEA